MPPSPSTSPPSSSLSAINHHLLTTATIKNCTSRVRLVCTSRTLIQLLLPLQQFSPPSPTGFQPPPPTTIMDATPPRLPPHHRDLHSPTTDSPYPSSSQPPHHYRDHVRIHHTIAATSRSPSSPPLKPLPNHHDHVTGKGAVDL
nr:hypothetical protein [Tanacetum cinerariifolium]